VLGKLGFHLWNDFSENHPQFGQVPSKRFTSPVPRWQSFKVSVRRSVILLTCLGHPHVLGQPCMLRILLVNSMYWTGLHYFTRTH